MKQVMTTMGAVLLAVFALGLASCGDDGGGSDDIGIDAGNDTGLCVPDCAGKQCGSDGCAGTCGTCPGLLQCGPVGICVSNGGCNPNCAGKQCGGDGCGGLCGQCPAGSTCSALGSCSNSCQPNCAGKQCGDDGCGGRCGVCGAGQSCNNFSGICEAGCTPNCAGKNCGGDGCGGSCGICANGDTCSGGVCESQCTPSCAGKLCGPNGCGGSCGICASPSVCSADGTKCESVGSCTPDCANRVCGNDGCGGKCGNCEPGQNCTPAGQCQGSCTPNCTGKNCGGDGCGGVCGTCPNGQVCGGTGQCEGGVCSPDCAGKQCGSDGCGSVCGTCQAGESCTATGQCQGGGGCTPSCAGKNCGDDGCGGVCGSCPGSQVCSSAGICTGQGCTPNCLGRVCGNDGCGGSCGSCPVGDDCNGAGQCAGGGGTACTPLAITGDLQAAGLGSLFRTLGVSPIGGPNDDMLQLEFYSNDPGVFDLASPINSSYATCNQCVRVFQDVDSDDGSSVKQFFQQSGSVLLNAPPLDPAGVSGSLTNVTLVEVTVDQDFVSTPVPGGDCLTIGTAQLTMGGCVPDCTNKVCGSDGCGGTCGSCPAGQICGGTNQCEAPATCAPVTVGTVLAGTGSIFETQSVSPPLGAAGDNDVFALEFWTSDTGTFQLGEGDNDNYQTCSQCVLLTVDAAGATRQYFGTSGTVVVPGGSNPNDDPSGVVIQNVQLDEVTIDSGYVSTPVPGGSCLTIQGPLTFSLQ